MFGLINTKNIISGTIVEGSIINNDTSPDDIKRLQAQLQDMQMKIGILEETIHVLKKDPGIDQSALCNREKAVIIDALKTKYLLPLLLRKKQLSKSSYYYQKKVLSEQDKHKKLRLIIKKLFDDNKCRYGYRRIHTLLKRKGIIILEKIVRRIMKEESFIVKVKKTGKYNSYAGEITPPVDNVISRNFKALHPNEKWLTDITEFSIPVGKVYLSPSPWYFKTYIFFMTR